MIFKTCTRCGAQKLFTQFNRARSFRDGLRFDCKLCHRAKAVADYYAHHELSKERAKLYYKRNKVKVDSYKKEWGRKNIKLRRSYQKRYRDANPDKMRQYRENYDRKHPFAMSLFRMRRKRRLRELPNTLTDSDMRFALHYFGGCCVFCGTRLTIRGNLSWDHWVPVTDTNCPGTTPDNMLPCCISCNASKNDSYAGTWLADRLGHYGASCLLDRIWRFLNRPPTQTIIVEFTAI